MIIYESGGAGSWWTVALYIHAFIAGYIMWDVLEVHELRQELK